MESESGSTFRVVGDEDSDYEEYTSSKDVDILYKRRTEDKLYDSAVDMRIDSVSDKYYLYKCGDATQPRNGYLNFLRDYRRRNRSMSPLETLQKGAAAWKNLTEDMKKNYMKGFRLLTPEECAACGCSKKKKMKKKRGCKPKRRSCKPKKRSCKPKVKRCRPKKKRPSCRPKKKRTCRPKRKRC